MSRQIYKKTTMQVRIDRELHRLLKVEAARSNTTIKALVEEALTEAYMPNENGELKKILKTK